MQSRLIVVVPGSADGAREADRARLEVALVGLHELRAGRAGVLALRPAVLGAEDALVAPSKTWMSVTPYVVNRHAKASGAAAALISDAIASCRDAGLHSLWSP
jgi:hypothetical protein